MVLDTKWENLSHHVKPASRGRHILCMAAGWGRKSFISTVPREKFIYLILLDSKTFTLGLTTLWIIFCGILWVVEEKLNMWWGKTPSLAVRVVSCPSQVECTQVLPSKWWSKFYFLLVQSMMLVRGVWEVCVVQEHFLHFTADETRLWTSFCPRHREFWLSVTNWSESTGHIRCFLWQGREMWVSWWNFLHQQSLCFEWARTCRFLWDNFWILQAEWK